MNETLHEPLPAEAQPDWRAQIERLGADRLLVLLGGIAAIALGTLALVLQLVGEGYEWPRGFGFTALGGAIFGYAVAFAFGLALLLAFAQMERRPAEGSIVALAVSVVLLAFSATPGVIAGVLGLVGALVGIVRNLRLAAG